MKAYGETLKKLRQRNGFLQADVAKMLNQLDIPCRTQQVSRWETDYNNPSIEQFIGLCSLYGLEDVFAVFEKGEQVVSTSQLNPEGKMKLREYQQLLVASRIYQPATSKRDNSIHIPARELPIYDIAASAGTGQFLDSDSYELVEVPACVPESANYGLHVAGDSMEPTLEDGQEIWVHMQPTLENGDVGIFFFEGNAFVKEYRKTSGGVYLISHNNNYAPIEISSDSEARIYGKVVYPVC